jgi:hypothetical protein
MNLASESIDDIPDRATLRQILQILEAEAGVNESRPMQHCGGAPGNAPANGEGDLGELRGRLLREAARVSGAMNRTLGDVIQEAAKGAFTLATLRTLGDSNASKVEAALRELEHTAVPHGETAPEQAGFPPNALSGRKVTSPSAKRLGLDRLEEDDQMIRAHDVQISPSTQSLCGRRSRWWFFAWSGPMDGHEK